MAAAARYDISCNCSTHQNNDDSECDDTDDVDDDDDGDHHAHPQLEKLSLRAQAKRAEVCVCPASFYVLLFNKHMALTLLW